MARLLRIASVRVCLLASGVLALGAPLSNRITDTTAAGAADYNPFVTAYPGLATAPAPPWLRPGTRITYYSSAASVVGGTHQYIEDENGEWIDKSTGKRYTQENISSASGHGYTQINVAHMEGSITVLEIRSYTISGVSGPPTILTLGGAVGLLGAGSDFWLSPQVLAGIPDSRTPGLTVLRMPYPIAGRQYSAIRFQGEGQAWVFDLASGVLLHSSAAGVGPPIRGPVAKGESTQGSTYLSQNTLVGVRAMDLPWSSAPTPDWVARTRFLRYDGAINVYVPGNPPIPVPITLTSRWQKGGPNWAQYHQTFVQATGTGVPLTTEADRVFGPAIVGGLWVAPQALRQLRAGQVVDRDPVTQVTASVGEIGRTPQGSTTIVITETGAAQSIDYLYDFNTGVLLAVSSFNRVVNQQIQLRLVASQ